MNVKDFKLITADSRKVIPGALFVAVRGYASDGHNYIQSAIEKGATGIICEEIPQGINQEGVQFEVVENSRRALALAADEFYDHPSGKLTLVGITGTNGKTTTVTLLYRLFKGLGYQCGLLSTIANYVGDERFETENTTVDPVSLNALIRYRDEATGRLREDLNKKFAERNEQVSKMLEAMRGGNDDNV